jgi:dimethylhistidine N-methyltransferase
MTHDSEAARSESLSKFKDDVIAGLTKPEKSLPCKYFYDERGSKLFEQITTLEEYYPTRTELAIMQDNLAEIVESIGKDVNLIEFGSGSSVKTELLLAHADIRSYIPIDIAEKELLASADRIQAKHPELVVHPVAADYTEEIHLPTPLEGTRNVVYFPGSTIGNFEPGEAKQFLKRTLGMMGSNGALLIGVDLKKEKAILERAYNDEQGITAQFNCNLLDRINHELHPTPPFTGFTHSAIYSEIEGRIEMRLTANREIDNSVDGTRIHFNKGESILTEYSYKYTLEEFKALASSAELINCKCWVDTNGLFSIQSFESVSREAK